MYKQILFELTQKINKINDQITDLEKQKNMYQQAYDELYKLQNNYENKKGN